MNDLKVFSSSEFGELGVLVIDGKEWFPAIQCAKILGYSNPRKAVIDHCKGDGVTKRDGVSYSTNQYGVTTQQINEIKYINEGNLYRLIVSSKLPQAEKFERWVFDEVLPSIRQNGSYIPNAEELIAKTATAVVSEVMKQIAPFITGQFGYSECMLEGTPQPSKRYRRRNHSIISSLDKTLRLEVDEMLLDYRYTYKDVQAFLLEKGIKVSTSSIVRYCKWLELEI